jgi:hypothetical protein
VDEKRQSARQKLHSDVWVDIGGLTPILCKILDISYHGARLRARGDAALPDTVFVCIGASGRSAKVMWRSGAEYGVEFENPVSGLVEGPRRIAQEAEAPSEPPSAVVVTVDAAPFAPAEADEPDELDDGPDPLAAALAQLRRCIDRMRD